MSRRDMVRCADCNQPFEAGVQQCPNCGADKPWRWGWLLLFVLVAWGLLGGAFKVWLGS